MSVVLRPVEPADLPGLYEFGREPDAVHMAAFTAEDPSDRDAFDAFWRMLLADESVITRAIVADGTLVGSVSCFTMFGKRQVSYWIGRAYWGRGYATAALRAFLDIHAERPLFAQAAADNRGSERVLEKCGFSKIATERGYASARGEEIDETVWRLSRE